MKTKMEVEFEDILHHLRKGEKLACYDWPNDEYIHMDTDYNILDESNEEVNAYTILVNYDKQWLVLE